MKKILTSLARTRSMLICRSTNVNVTTVLFPESLEKAIPIRSIVQYCCEYCPLICPCCTCHSHTRVTVSTENEKRTYVLHLQFDLPLIQVLDIHIYICISISLYIYIYKYIYTYILIRHERRAGGLSQPLYRFLTTRW